MYCVPNGVNPTQNPSDNSTLRRIALGTQTTACRWPNCNI
jgi:hypothetical protein